MKLTELLKNKQSAETFKIDVNSTAKEAVELFTKHRVGSLVVTDGSSKLQGIVTERDVLYKCDGHPETMKIADIMTHKEDLIIATKDENLSYAMDVMINKRVRHLPIIDDGKLLGILSIGDVLKQVLEQSETEVKELREYIQDPYGINI